MNRGKACERVNAKRDRWNAIEAEMKAAKQTPEGRRWHLRWYLAHGRTVADLARIFRTDVATIRRDLAWIGVRHEKRVAYYRKAVAS